MSLFYVLPPRPLLGDQVVHFLQSLFPGLDWNVSERWELAELLVDSLLQREDLYIVHRDDLPPGQGILSALVDGFGAEEGDEVVEVRPGLSPGEFTARRWRISVAALGGLPTSGRAA